jgi:hypothetical protein
MPAASLLLQSSEAVSGRCGTCGCAVHHVQCVAVRRRLQPECLTVQTAPGADEVARTALLSSFKAHIRVAYVVDSCHLVT